LWLPRASNHYTSLTLSSSLSFYRFTSKFSRKIKLSFEKEREKEKMHDFCFTIPYGLVLVGGGLFGFIQKGSTASLAGGVGTGLILILAGYLSLSAFGKRKNSYLALAIEIRMFFFQFSFHYWYIIVSFMIIDVVLVLDSESGTCY
jgi:uncharacterized membrane protein (UPF0136 family)